MIQLNLLPPNQKKELEMSNLSRLFASLSVWLLVFLIIFSLLLTSSFFCLSILLKEQERLIEIRKSDTKIKNLMGMEEKIKQANQVIKQVYSKQEKIVLWTPLLEEMAEIVPDGIYLANFSYQAANRQITLSGRAEFRKNLLHFQELLEKSPFFESVKLPLSNLIREKDINFSFNLRLR